MADEAEIRISLRVNKGKLVYQSNPTAYSATVEGQKGPTPGAITVSTEGTIVEFDQLEVPGLCRLMNLDDENFVEYGLWDGVTFYPFGEMLPGEIYIVRFSRNLGQEYGTGTGTGTGTGGLVINKLWLRANTDNCSVLVEAFEA